jgi:hypothetical protein
VTVKTSTELMLSKEFVTRILIALDLELYTSAPFGFGRGVEPRSCTLRTEANHFGLFGLASDWQNARLTVSSR